MVKLSFFVLFAVAIAAKRDSTIPGGAAIEH
jgi:hypothetical protein